VQRQPGAGRGARRAADGSWSLVQAQLKDKRMVRCSCIVRRAHPQGGQLRRLLPYGSRGKGAVPLSGEAGGGDAGKRTQTAPRSPQLLQPWKAPPPSSPTAGG